MSRGTSAVKAPGPDHWATREFQHNRFFRKSRELGFQSNCVELMRENTKVTEYQIHTRRPAAFLYAHHELVETELEKYHAI